MKMNGTLQRNLFLCFLSMSLLTGAINLTGCMKKDVLTKEQKDNALVNELLNNTAFKEYVKEEKDLFKQYIDFLNNKTQEERRVIITDLKNHNRQRLQNFTDWAGYLNISVYTKKLEMQTHLLKELMKQYTDEIIVRALSMHMVKEQLTASTINTTSTTEEEGIEPYPDPDSCYNSYDSCLIAAYFTYLSTLRSCNAYWGCCYDVGQDNSCCVDVYFCETWANITYMNDALSCRISLDECIHYY